MAAGLEGLARSRKPKRTPAVCGVLVLRHMFVRELGESQREETEAEFYLRWRNIPRDPTRNSFHHVFGPNGFGSRFRIHCKWVVSHWFQFRADQRGSLNVVFGLALDCNGDIVSPTYRRPETLDCLYRHRIGSNAGDRRLLILVWFVGFDSFLRLPIHFFFTSRLLQPCGKP